MTPEDAKRLHWLAILPTLKKKPSIFDLVILVGFGNTFFKYASVAIPVALAVIALLVLFWVIRWRRFRYWIDGENLIAIGGGITKFQHKVPLDKIQAVDTTSSILHRFFGVSRVSVKTAAAGTQIELAALTKEAAADLAALLSTDVASDSVQNAVEVTSNARGLTTQEIVIAAATSNQFLVALGTVSVAIGQVVEFAENVMFAEMIETFDDGSSMSIVLGGLAIVVVLLVAWIGTVVYMSIVFKSFSIATRSDGEDERVVIRRGVGEIKEIEILRRRIQSVEFRQTPLQVLLGYGSLQVLVIGHADGVGKNTQLHPCLAKSEWDEFLAAYTPAFQIDEEKPTKAPSRAFPRFVFRAMRAPLILVVPSTIALIILTVFEFAFLPLVFAPLLLLVPAFIIGFVNHRFESISYGETSATITLQSWKRLIAVVRRDGFQRYEVSQNYFQRRKNLATFGMEVAAGALGVMHRLEDLEAEESVRFRAWLKPVAVT